jgi:hypothetical protein
MITCACGESIAIIFQGIKADRANRSYTREVLHHWCRSRDVR